MEYVAGENMKQVIERIGVAGMLDWRYAFKVAVHVARALEYAHGENILHRNVTPTNILLDAPTKVVKLGDLMLAKALEGGTQITRPGELVGDIVYMSPERTRGIPEEIDARSDLYGLGATVYALLAGRPPFEGGTLAEKVTRIRQNCAGAADEVSDVDPRPVRGGGAEAAGQAAGGPLPDGGRIAPRVGAAGQVPGRRGLELS